MWSKGVFSGKGTLQKKKFKYTGYFDSHQPDGLGTGRWTDLGITYGNTYFIIQLTVIFRRQLESGKKKWFWIMYLQFW